MTEFDAGPIIPFNNFITQTYSPAKSITRNGTIKYALRWLSSCLLMEILMHVFYVVAIKDAKAWKGYSSLEIFTLGYYNLVFIWMKV